MTPSCDPVSEITIIGFVTDVFSVMQVNFAVPKARRNGTPDKLGKPNIALAALETGRICERGITGWRRLEPSELSAFVIRNISFSKADCPLVQAKYWS